MKKQTLFILAMASIGLFSCKNISGKENVEAVVDSLKVDSIAVVTPTVDEIVKDSVTNPKGETLQMLFNNTTSIATFTLKNEVIEMKQDTTASGIQYSNENYLFTEWQGKMELKKDGKTIFSHQK